jgi:hypothetical protein
MPNLNIIQIKKKQSLENSKEVLIKMYIRNTVGYVVVAKRTV